MTANLAATRILGRTGGLRRPIQIGTSRFAYIGTLGFLLLAGPLALAATENRCDGASSVADASVRLSLVDGRTTFHSGEIVPLALSFTSSAKNRYWAEDRNYDRSGRLTLEYYCVEPQLPDPLATYFQYGSFMGGGLGNDRELGSIPFVANAELNEWRRPVPGHYRLYVISYRIWRPPDPSEHTPWGRISEVLRSNTVEFDVLPPDPEWSATQLAAALQSLQTPPDLHAPPGSDSARHAARVLRFLDTEASARLLAKEFIGLGADQPYGWEFMLGLFGSPFRSAVIQAMKSNIREPDHPVTAEYLATLGRLEISSDPAWSPPTPNSSRPEEAKDFWNKFQDHMQDLTKAAVQIAVASLPNKADVARAITLDGIVNAGGDDQSLVRSLRPELIQAWPLLPEDMRENLIEYRWPLVASPQMLPALRIVVDEPPPPARTQPAMMRDAALRHIFELNPEEGRSLILRDVENQNAHPGIDLVQLLSAEDIRKVTSQAVEKIANRTARELDFELLDRYGDANALPQIRPVFESQVGQWACQPQSAMLRFFVRVDPAYGRKQVAASLAARGTTGCYRMLLQDMGDELPGVETTAVAALHDPDPQVAQDAALALGRWGSASTEEALWDELRRLYQQWKGKNTSLRVVPDYNDPASRTLGLEQNLIHAVETGSNWICGPEKLKELQQVVLTEPEREEIGRVIAQWESSPAMILPSWDMAGQAEFSVLQYASMNEEQFRHKLLQFPPGTTLDWQFWSPGHIQPPVSMAKQEAAWRQFSELARSHGVTIARVGDSTALAVPK